MAASLLVVHVHVRVKPGGEEAFRAASRRQRRGEPARARRRPLRPARRPRRPPPLRPRRDLPRRRRGRRAQGDRPLRGLARRGGGPHGRAPPQREVRQPLARRRGLVSGVRFEFATATRIVFGPGSLAELGPLAAALGSRALLVTGRTPERAEGARERLASAGVATIAMSVTGEPTVEDARRGAELARSEGADLVVACGGGSAIDAGKAMAALLGNGGDPLDYLEVVGRGQPLARPSLPFVAIPTTAGTGSEVTRNAVLASPEHRLKASLRSPTMLPRAAIVDPDLLLGLPPTWWPRAASTPSRSSSSRSSPSARTPSWTRCAARASPAPRGRSAGPTRATAGGGARGPRARQPLRRARPRQRRPRGGARHRGPGRRHVRRAPRGRLRGPPPSAVVRVNLAALRSADRRAPRSGATARSRRSSLDGPRPRQRTSSRGSTRRCGLSRSPACPTGEPRPRTCRRSSPRPAPPAA